MILWTHDMDLMPLTEMDAYVSQHNFNTHAVVRKR